MDFVKQVDLKVGQKLLIVETISLVECNRTTEELLTTNGTGGSKDEPILLTVTGISKRDITAIDRYGAKYYFSKKTGWRNGHADDVARVATEAEITEIEAIIDYNRKVQAVRAMLDMGPGQHWDAVLELFSNLTVSQCYDYCASELPF